MVGLKQGSIAQRLSTGFRRRRDDKLRALIGRVAAGKGSVAIIDMGGSVDYWLRVGVDFLQARHCHVTIVNLIETELGTREAPAGLFTLAVGDACSIPQYSDRQFDLAHSNSVIEHVLTWPAMKRFANETRRVARNYYVQTPNFWFPIDPHYYKVPLFHLLPRPMRASLFKRFKVAQGGRAETWDHAYDLIDDSRLLSRQQMKTLFPDGRIETERLFGLSKSLIAVWESPA